MYLKLFRKLCFRLFSLEFYWLGFSSKCPKRPVETKKLFGYFCRFNCDGSALLSCAGLDALIWKVKPESDPLAEADQEEGFEGKTEYRVSSKEGVRVEEWPGYKPQPKARKKKEKE